MYEVIYFSRLGNTNKVAKAIAEELNVTARHVRTLKSLPDGASIILGSGLYFMRPAKLVTDFIKNNDFRGKRVALFGTSASGIGIEVWWMERLLKRKGAIIIGKYYCPGQFFYRLGGKRFSLMRKGQPADKDLAKAREFACSIRNRFEANAEAEIQEEKHEDQILSRV